MRSWFLLSLIITLGLSAGCASTYDRVLATQPDGGIIMDLSEPYDVVFPAAVRVMHLNKERIAEADRRTGRIISLGLFESRAIFLRKLPKRGTRVELSATMSRRSLSPFPGGPNAFFIQLKEQILAYKITKAKEKQRSQKEVDPDLRRVYRPQALSPPVLICEDCAPTTRVPYGRTVIKKRGLP